MIHIGERIVMYRVAHGLTQAEFAKLCGVSYSTISHIETEPDRPLAKMTIRKIEYVLMGGTIRKEP